jgi:hypothetical protein
LSGRIYPAGELLIRTLVGSANSGAKFFPPPKRIYFKIILLKKSIYDYSTYYIIPESAHRELYENIFRIGYF